MVYWIEPLTLDQKVAGSIPVNAWHFCPSARHFYPHGCSPPRCINGDPVGCERYVEYIFACNAMIGSSARNAPLGVEIVHCKCGLEIVSSDRGNNSSSCCAFNVLAGWKCAHYKCSYYYYYYYQRKVMNEIFTTWTASIHLFIIKSTTRKAWSTSPVIHKMIPSRAWHFAGDPKVLARKPYPIGDR